MTWAKLDDRANEHRKQLAAGPEACWLWACGLMYVNRQKERSGLIPALVLQMLYPFKNPAKLAAKLVEVGLWEKVADGYRVHDFSDWNKSAEEVEQERAEARERMRILRANKKTCSPEQTTEHEPEHSATFKIGSGSLPTPTPLPTPKGSNEPLAQRAQKVLDNPHDGRFARPSKWPEVIAASAALAPGRDLKLRDDVGKDSDLRAILDAFAAGYSVADLERAGAAAASDAWFQKLDRPGPCAFTATVLRRLLDEKPPGQLAHEAATGKPGNGGRKWTETGRDSSGKPCAWTDEQGRTTYKNPFQEAS